MACCEISLGNLGKQYQESLKKNWRKETAKCCWLAGCWLELDKGIPQGNFRGRWFPAVCQAEIFAGPNSTEAHAWTTGNQGLWHEQCQCHLPIMSRHLFEAWQDAWSLCGNDDHASRNATSWILCLRSGWGGVEGFRRGFWNVML